MEKRGLSQGGGRTGSARRGAGFDGRPAGGRVEHARGTGRSDIPSRRDQTLERAAHPPFPQTMSRTPRAVAILTIVLAAFLLGGIAIPLTNHPDFCAGCHTIKPSYDTWKASTHKDVTCVACHVRPGFQHWLQDKAWNGTKDLAITLFGTPTDPHNLTA